MLGQSRTDCKYLYLVLGILGRFILCMEMGWFPPIVSQVNSLFMSLGHTLLGLGICWLEQSIPRPLISTVCMNE